MKIAKPPVVEAVGRLINLHRVNRALVLVFAALALVSAIVAWACGGAAPSSPTSSGERPSGQIPCDGSLWNHVYDSGRLQLRQPCITVTGTVTDFHSNDDGDVDIRIDVDQPYKNLLNGGNISDLNGHLQTEAICQAPPTVADAIQACRGFNGSVAVPAVGAHVQVTGSYVFDTNHGWMEVHPITALRQVR
jgi:hypothetical protein